MRLRALSALLLLAACGPKETAPQTCNGSEVNCSRRYDQVTIAATHNAFAYADGPVTYTEPNQDLPISIQLAYGIRGIGIRPCPPFGAASVKEDTLYVTHNYSTLGGILGGEPLINILTEIKTFLDAHPSETVTLLEEDSSVSSAQVAAVFHQAGLDSMLYVHDKAKGWPTLGEMAKTGKRLVVFTDANDTREPWQLPMWSYITDTDYNTTDASQFSCDTYRGAETNDLYFINQFIYADYGGGIVAASPETARIANEPEPAYQRAVKCWQQLHKVPVFIYVDFFKEGDVKQVVDRLNLLPR